MSPVTCLALPFLYMLVKTVFILKPLEATMKEDIKKLQERGTDIRHTDIAYTILNRLRGPLSEKGKDYMRAIREASSRLDHYMAGEHTYKFVWIGDN